MKCLIISHVFPNRLEPWRGPYNRRQVECLAKHCRIDVINPLPWVSLLSGKRYWTLVGRPDRVLDGIVVRHPVFWYLPVAGRAGSWRGVLAAAERALEANSGETCDAVLATFAYPHGLAAVRLSRRLGVPCLIKVRGSDLHSLPPSGNRRRRTAEALRGGSAVVAVSSNLARIATQLGCPAERVHVLTNGVDTAAFPLLHRGRARRRLGVEPDGAVVLFAGNLERVKGIDVLLEAFAMDAVSGRAAARPRLAVAGTGPLHRWMRKQVARSGLREDVRILGDLSRREMALWMNAADALVLPSRNEGCPNVVLEALSCGTPVVASRVGGIPDLIDETCGIMVEPENPAELSAAIRTAIDAQWDRTQIRRRVQGMSWEANAAALYRILTDAVRTRRLHGSVGPAGSSDGPLAAENSRRQNDRPAAQSARTAACRRADSKSVTAPDRGGSRAQLLTRGDRE